MGLCRSFRHRPMIRQSLSSRAAGVDRSKRRTNLIMSLLPFPHRKKSFKRLYNPSFETFSWDLNPPSLPTVKQVRDSGRPKVLSVREATLCPFTSHTHTYNPFPGTGKTHTMEGDLSHPDLHGVIPRSAAAIFQALEHPHYLEKNLSVSFLEIYNEDLCDLLADTTTTGSTGVKITKPTTTKLDIMEGKNGPFCR